MYLELHFVHFGGLKILVMTLNNNWKMKKLCAFFFVYHIVVFKICASGFVRKRDNWLEILVSR